MATPTINLATTGDALPFLTFAVAGQSCCFPVKQVVRIIEMVTVTRLPAVPRSIQGIINVHGQPVPVVDLRQQLGLPRQAYDLNTPIILVEVGHNGSLVGVIVDAVEDVLYLTQGHPPSRPVTLPVELAGALPQQANWLTGIVTVEERMMLILDAGSLLPPHEQQQLSQILDRQVQFSL